MYVVPEALRGLQADYLAAWAPEPRPSIIDWSEKNIFLSERNSPVAGRLRLWPYQKGMLLAMVDLELPIISVMKSSRIGFTKTMMCILGHYAHRNPCSVALLEPTLDDTRKISIFEINPLFEESPVLRGLVHRSSPGPRKASEPDNSALTTMLFPGAGSLRILSAGSPRMLRGSDIKVLLADEIDAYEISREGDALAIATQRTLSHSDRKIIVGSSPTFEGASVIERRYAESDQRIYECPCPKCGVYFELLWAHVHWPQGSPQEAFVVCPHCHEDIDESFKTGMVEKGRWRITRPEVKGHAGFRLNSLISLFANASWGNLAGEFEKANKAGPSLLSVFHNTTLGLPYKLQIDSVGQSFLRSKAEDFSLDNLPEQVLLITCGCDVQMQRIEMLFLGFAVDGTTFILAHQVLHGSTHSGAPVWKQLDNVLGKQYVHPKGYRLKVESCCVDSGGTGTGSESRTQAVYDYTRAKSHRKIFAIKSVPGSRPVWAQAATSKGQSLLILLGIDSLKTDVLAGLAALPFIDNDGNPTATETGVRNILSYRISNTLSDNTLEQLVSEGRFLTTVKGREVMAFKLVRQGARNEALDACCYALGARAALRSVNLRHRAGRSGADEQSKGSMGERFGKLSDASVLG